MGESFWNLLKEEKELNGISKENLRAAKKVCKEEEKLAKIDDKNPYNLSVRIEDSRLDLFFIFLFLFLFLFI